MAPDPADIQVRPAQVSDLPDIVVLLQSLTAVAGTHAELTESSVRARFQAMLTNPGRYYISVAVCDDRVVGMSGMTMYHSLFHERPTALITELVVREPFRGRGIGTCLVKNARDTAISAQCACFEVGTELDNVKAQAFYRKNGFDLSYALMGSSSFSCYTGPLSNT